MATLRSLPPEARRILDLAARDRSAARKALAEHARDEQVALICETPVARRAALVELLETPEQVIPALPPAELCYTAQAMGLADAGPLLEHASESQITTCVDLDAWGRFAPDLARVGEWLTALADAGDEALLSASRAIDMEVLTLHLQSRFQVILKPQDDDWSPPLGGHSLDGQFYLVPLREGDDVADLLTLLRVLFQHDYWVYFRLLQACQWELPPETTEWALRWRNGRLQDLGFPPWEEAAAIYGYLRPELWAVLPESERIPLGEWPLPVWMPRLPIAADAPHSLLRAMAALPDDERRQAFYAFLALANRVAVADRMALGDAETIPRAVDKAARVASRGLDFVSRERDLDPVEIVRRATMERLFRVGFQLDPSEAPPPPEEEAEEGGPEALEGA